VKSVTAAAHRNMGTDIAQAWRREQRTETTLFDDLDEEGLRKLLGLKKIAKEDLAYMEKRRPTVDIKSDKGVFTQKLTSLERETGDVNGD
jgi:hypothetical protein